MKNNKQDDDDKENHSFKKIQQSKSFFRYFLSGLKEFAPYVLVL